MNTSLLLAILVGLAPDAWRTHAAAVPTHGPIAHESRFGPGTHRAMLGQPANRFTPNAAWSRGDAAAEEEDSSDGESPAPRLQLSCPFSASGLAGSSAAHAPPRNTSRAPARSPLLRC